MWGGSSDPAKPGVCVCALKFITNLLRRAKTCGVAEKREMKVLAWSKWEAFKG